jgi:hypothetical protein
MPSLSRYVWSGCGRRYGILDERRLFYLNTIDRSVSHTFMTLPMGYATGNISTMLLILRGNA